MRALKRSIREVLSTFADQSLRECSKRLLTILGYESDRIPALEDKATFLELCKACGGLSENQIESLNEVTDLKAVLQFTEEELKAQNYIFSATDRWNSNAESFLFLSIDLKDGDYTRSKLAATARAITHPFAMPVIMFFRYRRSAGDLVITVAVVRRRQHKRDPSRYVHKRVILVKDIRTKNPHRAHIDVLAGMSLHELAQSGRIRNFDQLLRAWERALDTEPLNRRFYQGLFKWFVRAAEEASWPAAAPKEQQVIRCITRVLFVWFIKEKRLVADDWFDQRRMEDLLCEFGGTDYYRAVLQNLFFASLNTPLDERAWSTQSRENDQRFNKWQYRSLIRDANRFRELMGKTPFINGGLFDCLDDHDPKSASRRRVDMFCDPDPAHGLDATNERDQAWNALRVPDKLFFDEHGLFALLNRFVFTVKENTPIEAEVALDPELLGKVFENLLAAYNPETRDTARKQTGSYYTPRPVVDYMVDEALVTALVSSTEPGDGDSDFWRERLHYLLDFEDADELFDHKDAGEVVEAIANLKVLDPAVGSGAFPMAVLNKLTLALRRLDPKNELWQSLQKLIAERRFREALETKDRGERDQALLEISDTFERYSGDFGRKLYLIQNSIYGVDVQPIACQIAKLRLFISLAIEQEPNTKSPNFGIKPLPNLETRFVVADTLLRLNRVKKPSQQFALSQQNELVLRLEGQLVANRERHFHATSPQAKRDCMKEDQRLRNELAVQLKAIGFEGGTAEKVAHWNPYDQNAVANWFDKEYMFGVQRGFDVVIGNPPYIQLQKNRGALGKLYKSAGYETYARTGDIYQLFLEKGCRLLRPGGALAYITSNSWLRAKYGEKLREYIASRHAPQRLIDMGKDVFDAVVDASVLTVRAVGRTVGHGETQCDPFPGVDTDRITDPAFPPRKDLWGQVRPSRSAPWSILSEFEWRVMEKMKAAGKPLRDWGDIAIYRGILTGYNKAFLIDDTQYHQLIREDPKSAEILKPVLRGRDIQR